MFEILIDGQTNTAFREECIIPSSSTDISRVMAVDRPQQAVVNNKFIILIVAAIKGVFPLKRLFVHNAK